MLFEANLCKCLTCLHLMTTGKVCPTSWYCTYLRHPLFMYRRRMMACEGYRRDVHNRIRVARQR